LAGCSNGPAGLAPSVLLRVVSVQRNAEGKAVVQLSLTNTTTRSILVGGRSVIEQKQGVEATNYSNVPVFVGLAGAGSMASDLTLGPRVGMSATLSPVKVSGPFRLEFVCFPRRKGLPGVADRVKDKLQTWTDGSQHESHRGESFFLVSPLITALSEPDATSNAAEPRR
jgi:hypothetical protein